MEKNTTQAQIELVTEHPKDNNSFKSKARILTKSHVGYFRISFSLSLCSQALLWKILISSPNDGLHASRKAIGFVPQIALSFLWSLALLTLASQSVLYALRCVLHFDMVKAEFVHHIGVNYLFAPWIAWLLLLQSSPFIAPESGWYRSLWWVFAAPVVALDIKIYGQWLTEGKRFLWSVANPTSQLSVIGNQVAARGAAQMGWKETAVCMFSLGMAHYLVLFVTLYQRLPGNNALPSTLKPVICSCSSVHRAWPA